jgi:hypothetical protein
VSGIPRLFSHSHGETDRLTFFVAADSPRSAAYHVRLQLENSGFFTSDFGRAEREAQDVPPAKVFQVDVTVKEWSMPIRLTTTIKSRGLER